MIGARIQRRELISPIGWLVSAATATLTIRTSAPIRREELAVHVPPGVVITAAARTIAPIGWSPPLGAFADARPSSAWTVHVRATDAAAAQWLTSCAPEVSATRR